MFNLVACRHSTAIIGRAYTIHVYTGGGQVSTMHCDGNSVLAPRTWTPTDSVCGPSHGIADSEYLAPAHLSRRVYFLVCDDDAGMCCARPLAVEIGKRGRADVTDDFGSVQ